MFLQATEGHSQRIGGDAGLALLQGHREDPLQAAGERQGELAGVSGLGRRSLHFVPVHRQPLVPVGGGRDWIPARVHWLLR